MLRANYVHWGSGAHNSGLEMFKFFSRLGPQLLVWAHNSGLEMFKFLPRLGPQFIGWAHNSGLEMFKFFDLSGADWACIEGGGSE